MLDDMIKRIELMSNPQYKNDMDKLVYQITKFLDKYKLQGVMGFYKEEQFKVSVLFDEDAVNMHINNP